jgi:hypothetical protein
LLGPRNCFSLASTQVHQLCGDGFHGFHTAPTWQRCAPRSNLVWRLRGLQFLKNGMREDDLLKQVAKHGWLTYQNQVVDRLRIGDDDH